LPLPERKLIERIRRLAGRAPTRGLITGIGDDAAVLRLQPGFELLVTTDLTLEGVHFRREWNAPEVVGHRALLRGLSDIAAMGGEPFAAFLSLALPRKLPQAWADGFFRGFLHLARRYGVALAGGDTGSSTAGVIADVIVLGRVPRGSAVTRSGAGVGDVICVTGNLGGGAALIRQLRAGKRGKARDLTGPEPRIAVGRWLREQRLPTAMIDVSDGLSVDLLHICQESGVGAAIMENAVPRAAGATLQEALHGGEDYELLFTVSRGKKVPMEVAGVPINPIGEIIRSRTPQVRILSGGRWKRLKPAGWEHFR
jgi:thiamine-monophosphate kinase